VANTRGTAEKKREREGYTLAVIVLALVAIVASWGWIVIPYTFIPSRAAASNPLLI